MRIQTLADLQAVQQRIEKDRTALSRKTQVIIYGGTCGYASGAKEVRETIQREVAECGLENVAILEHSCMGCCYIEPYITVTEPGGDMTLYGDLSAEKAGKIVTDHLVNGQKVKDYQVDLQIPFFTRQEKRITALLGQINPFNIDDYICHEGYQGLAKALGMKREEVIEEVTASGLRGRGGAGFPTGVKWKFAFQAQGDQKYMVCNADEGDPGAYMNRAELEGNPHAVLEGMAIAAYAIGADKGYIYVRAEYPLAVETLEKAIEQARAYGLLGKHILGRDYDYDIEL
jgi:(2Fe-2S) ferredoxin